MEVLTDVLKLTGVTGGVFIDAEFTAPWSVSGKVSQEHCRPFMEPPERVVAFHYVVEGEVHVSSADGSRSELRAGEVVLLPRNDLHVLASAEGIPPVSMADFLGPMATPGVTRIVRGGGGARSRLVCGFLGGNAHLHPLLANLPPVMTLDLATLPSGQWIAQTFEFAARALAERDAGTTAMLAKVAELMFVEALRRYLAALPAAETGWLAGLRDPCVGRALALMHARIDENWTTEALAREANLSRSAFAERFTALIGSPPMRYLLDWRMQVAKQKLEKTRAMVAQIAFEVGYESEASFTRAFRREVGMPPAAWRTQKRADLTSG